MVVRVVASIKEGFRKIPVLETFEADDPELQPPIEAHYVSSASDCQPSPLSRLYAGISGFLKDISIFVHSIKQITFVGYEVMH